MRIDNWYVTEILTGDYAGVIAPERNDRLELLRFDGDDAIYLHTPTKQERRGLYWLGNITERQAQNAWRAFRAGVKITRDAYRKEA